MTDVATPLMPELTQAEVNDITAVMDAELAIRDANSPERVAAADAHTMGKVAIQHEVQKITVQ